MVSSCSFVQRSYHLLGPGIDVGAFLYEHAHALAESVFAREHQWGGVIVVVGVYLSLVIGNIEHIHSRVLKSAQFLTALKPPQFHLIDTLE